MSAFQEKVEILKNANVGDLYFKLVFESARFAKHAKPGQFMLIKAGAGLEPLLRKPLGFHSVKKGAIEVLYEKVGKGTEILSGKRPGEILDIIGPLGNGFEYQDGGQPILVAGGIGIAPLVFLAQRLAYSVERIADRKKIHVIIGAKTKSCLLCEKEFKDLGCEIRVCTDDGSRCHKGFVTDLLNKELSAIRYPLPAVYACGPKPMLRATAAVAKRYGVKCQVLLEEYMACGVGACLGCAVETREGYKMVCKDGPVFEASEIIW